MKILKRNPFGHILVVKKILIIILGAMSYRRYGKFNKLKIKGSDVLKKLPNKGVLFVSNHQTYFADVGAMFHVFNAAKKKPINQLRRFNYLWRPKLNMYYVAALETMKAGLLPKIFAYTGSVSIERTWRNAGKNINRKVKISDIQNIGIALKDGWVITFPQGTTKPFSPVRRGTAHIIKTYKPVVVPIVIDGFRRAYDKKGLLIKKKGVQQSMTFKEPLEIDYENENFDTIVKKIAFAIEQDTSFLKIKTSSDLV